MCVGAALGTVIWGTCPKVTLQLAYYRGPGFIGSYLDEELNGRRKLKRQLGSLMKNFEDKLTQYFISSDQLVPSALQR